MTNYTHLFFDLDNTLFDFSACEQAALVTFFTALCGDVKADYIKIYEYENSICWQAVEKGQILIDDVNKIRVGKTMEALLNQGVDLKLTQAEAEKILVDALSENDVLFDGAYKLVQDLSEKYTLIAITNGFNQVKVSHMSQSGLMPYFKAMYTSQAVGYSKPNSKFFDAVFADIKVKKTECLVVGDSLESDMKGAKLYGLDACWFNFKGMVPEQKTFQYEVANHTQLRKLLLNE